MRCTINTQDVVHEAMDGEVVIVNLKNGRYYSLIDTGSLIWDYILSGRSSRQIEQELQNQFSDPERQIPQALSNFVHHLAEEGLVRLEADSSSAEPPVEPGNDHSPPFRPPVLTAHQDMEGLLLLDPIHDVSEQGWPEPKPVMD